MKMGKDGKREDDGRCSLDVSHVFSIFEDVPLDFPTGTHRYFSLPLPERSKVDVSRAIGEAPICSGNCGPKNSPPRLCVGHMELPYIELPPYLRVAQELVNTSNLHAPKEL